MTDIKKKTSEFRKFSFQISIETYSQQRLQFPYNQAFQTSPPLMLHLYRAAKKIRQHISFTIRRTTPESIVAYSP
jgi:hypothetical protein